MHFVDTDPVSIHKMLYEKDILCLFRPLDENFSGMAIRAFDKNQKARRFMLVNSAQGYGKQRFTACHELYHLLFQQDFTFSRNNAGKFLEKDVEEYKADIFATHLLLPQSGIIQLIPTNERGKVSLGTVIQIEQRFRCSRMALLRRLKELKQIDSVQFDSYMQHPMKSALEYGFTKELYRPTHKNEIVGDYNIKARKLLENGIISYTKYHELLDDMGLDLKFEENVNG